MQTRWRRNGTGAGRVSLRRVSSVSCREASDGGRGLGWEAGWSGGSEEGREGGPQSGGGEGRHGGSHSWQPVAGQDLVITIIYTINHYTHQGMVCKEQHTT